MDKLILVYFLLSGADIFSFKFLGNTIRVVNIYSIILVFILILLDRYKINKQILKIYWPIIAIHFISIFYSISPKKSLAYLIYILFYFIFTLNLMYSWGNKKKVDKIIEIYIFSFRIVSILTIIQFFLGNLNILKILEYQFYGGVFRPALWFYEPSFLATFLSLYYMLSFILRKIYYKDLILSIVAIILTTSSTGYLSLIVGFVLYLIFSKESLLEKIKLLIKLITIGSVILGIIFLLKKEIIYIFIGRLFRDGISVSSGGRTTINKLTLDIICDNWMIGLGTNSFEEYTGLPPMNVTLEVFVTLGILFGSIFIFFFFYVNMKLYKKNNYLYKAFVISFILFFIILQANQNYMRLYMWNHLAIMLVFLQKREEK